jgi:hypothetical protein
VLQQCHEGLTTAYYSLAEWPTNVKDTAVGVTLFGCRYGLQRPLLPSFLRGKGGGNHLTGEVAGDVGFDPLDLSTQPETFAK